MAKQIRHGPNHGFGLVAIVLSILLFGCSGGANQSGIQQENISGSQEQVVSPTTGHLEELYTQVSRYSYNEMIAKSYDPAGLANLAFPLKGTSSVPSIETLYDVYANWDEIKAQIASAEANGLKLTMADIDRMAKYTPAGEDYMAVRQQLVQKSRSVSATGGNQIYLEPIRDPYPLGDYTVYQYQYPFGDLGPTQITVELSGPGSAWIGSANFSDLLYRWWGEQKGTSALGGHFETSSLDEFVSSRAVSSVDSGFGEGAHTVTLNNPDIKERFISSYKTLATGVFFIICKGDITVADGNVPHQVAIKAVSRYDRDAFVGTSGYTYGEVGLDIQADTTPDEHSGSAVALGVDIVDYNAVISFEWEYEANFNIKEPTKRDTMVVATPDADLEEHTDNDGNSPDESMPISPGPHTWYTAGYNLDGQGAWVEAGTASVGLIAVSDLVASYDQATRTVTLGWDLPAQTVTNVLVEWSPDSQGFTQLTELGNVATYQHVLGEGQSFGHIDYKLKAKYVNGQTTVLSDYSSVVSLSTLDFTVASGTAVGDGKVITSTDYRSNGDLVGVGRSGSDVVLYECIAGVWGSAQTMKAGFGGNPEVLVIGSDAYVFASNDSDGLKSFKFDLDGVNPVEEATIRDNTDGLHPGGVLSINSVGGQPAVVYSLGNDTIRYARYSSGWTNDHQIASLPENPTTIVLVELSGGNPALGIRTDVVTFISASSNTPDDMTDWGADTLAGTVPDVPFSLIVNDAKPVFGYQNNGLRITKSAVGVPDDATDWSTLLLAGGNVVGKPQLATVPITGGDRLVAFYSLGSDVADTAPDIMATACADAFPSGSSSWAIRTVVANQASDPAWMAMPATMNGGGSLMVTTVGSLTPTSTLYQFDW